MTTGEMISSTHISIDSAILRVYANGSYDLDFEKMLNDAEKPKFVFDVCRSTDPKLKQVSFLVFVAGDYDVNELSNWLNKF